MMLNTRKAWQKKLKKLRDNHQTKETPPKTTIGKSDALLKQVHALQLLRDMKQFLLDGVGKIELFKNTNGYDLVLALMWNGTISKPEIPRSESKQRRHIFIGVRGGEIYVNGKHVPIATEQALQDALLAAAENPGFQRNETGE